MTIECYKNKCPYHSSHFDPSEEGPFCYEEECREEDTLVNWNRTIRLRKKDPSFIEDCGPTNEQMEHFKRGGR